MAPSEVEVVTTRREGIRVAPYLRPTAEEREALHRSPLPSSTAKAEARSVLPTQKPSAIDHLLLRDAGGLMEGSHYAGTTTSDPKALITAFF